MRLRAGMVAALTGAGSGIGRALALHLAARGAQLALADLDEHGLAETDLLTHPFGTQVTTHRLDVADEAAVQAFARAVEGAHGQVQLLVNNAGVALGGRFEECSTGDLAWLMGVNFWGVVHGCAAFLPLLRRSERAHIVNLSSVFGLVGPPGQSAYAASKFAVRGFSEALRAELRGSAVGLSVVHPGGIRTNIARRARLGSHSTQSADEVAREVLEFERRLVLSPQAAAERILRGVERDEARILVGRDAEVLDAVARLFPARAWDLLERLRL